MSHAHQVEWQTCPKLSRPQAASNFIPIGCRCLGLEDLVGFAQTSGNMRASKVSASKDAETSTCLPACCAASSRACGLHAVLQEQISDILHSKTHLVHLQSLSCQGPYVYAAQFMAL
jgi:hypothetical protein